MNLIPYGDRVVIRQAPKATQSAGGVLLPDTVGEDHTEGTILALGPDVHGSAFWGEETIGLCVGDRVVFTKWSGSEIKIDGETFVIIREKDIVAIYSEDPAPAPTLPSALPA